MAENNEDFLTQCLLTMKGTLEADAYFSPTASAPIPVVVEVNQDIQQAIQMVQMRGLLVTIAMEQASATGQGGCLTASVQFVVRVLEMISVNRSPSGIQENGLRVASKIAGIINGSPAAKREDGSTFGGGSYKFTGITPAMMSGPDGLPNPQGRAYHVNFSIPQGTLNTFTRRNGSPPAGAP
jgi:hypothetical protein